MVEICERHGGAGWTRTSDNAIMSRALYHLSYGTVIATARAGRTAGEILASGLCPRLQLALLTAVLGDGNSLPLVHGFSKK
jgi:hypothetical protein